VRTEVIEGFPLSPQQKHLWSLQQIDHSSAYRAQCAVLIEGPLDTEALQSAVQDVFARHEILRTTFHCPPGAAGPMQVIGQASILSINRYDVSNCGPMEQEARMDSLLQEASEFQFDLEKGPLSHLSLVTFSNDRHTLLVSLPSLCCDAVSLNSLVTHICSFYSSSWRHEEPFEQPLQYADLAEWQNELLVSPDGAKGREYWRRQSASESHIVKLPIEDGICGTTSFVPHVLTLVTNCDTAAEIRTAVQKYDTSPSVFLLACLQSLLWRLTAQTDLSIGVSCEARTYEGLHRAFGLFAKILPVRVCLEGDLRFSELLERTEESVCDAREWQEYFNWEPVVGWEADESSPPFFDLVFECGSRPAVNSGAIPRFSIARQFVCSDRFKVKLSCVEQNGGLDMELHYDSNLFRAADIGRFGAQFLVMLKSAIANPENAISELEILDDAERERLLVEFNDTESISSDNAFFHQLFEEQVKRTPGRVALEFEDQRLTYAQLNARANQVANYLRALGVGPEVPVAICMERCLEMVVGLIGILKAGGAYLPLDPAYPKERLAFILQDAGTRVLLTMGYLRKRLPDQGVRLICLDADSDSIAGESFENPLHLTRADNLAYVIYTSGSTGQPKGVMVEHRGLSNTIRWLSQTLAITGADSTLLKTPITFDAAGRELFPTLLAGARLIIAEPNGHRDCRYIAEQIRANGISILHGVPSFLRLLIEEPAFADALQLRAVMCGGETLTADTVAKFSQRSGARLYNVYGPTEAIIDSAYWLCGGNRSDSIIPIGRPISNARMYILDAGLRPVPIGVAGELHIGGVSLARGYLNRPDLTAEKFIPNPFTCEPGARLYKTGDLARYLPDGNIQYLGRGDYQVKIRGFRIELGEIEGALAQHTSVHQAIVTIHESASGEKRLVSYVVAHPACAPTAVELRRFLKEKLPEHMVPAAFVLLDVLPLTPHGKVDRQALSAPDQSRPELDKAFVGFRTPTEELLVDIWAQVLGVPRIGIYDNFFDLGGHSLLATQVVSRVRDAFQVEIPLRRLFETPTVAGLADSLERSRRGGQNLQVPPIQPAPRDGDLPLSFAQQRLWFIDQLDPGNCVYNFPVAVRLKGSLNLAALKQSLNEIVRRHEALRTTFTTVDGQPSQVIAPRLIISLPVVNLRELAEVERENEVQRLVIEEARRSFDLAQGPLLRASILELSEDEQVGLLTMHHIVSDGWSTGILIREMAILYEAFCSGNSSPLPELPIQYADFAYWQREWLQGTVLQTQIDYWKQRLSGSPPLLELPTDHPRPAVQTFRGGHQSLLLPKALGSALSTLSRQEGATLFMTLLAAFKVLLRCYTSQDDLVVGTPVANRNRLEIEGLIGFFVNALVLRTDLSGNPTFRELVRRVREICLGAYAHQDLPFERLVEELHLERDLSRNPLFQVMFVLQNASVQTVDLAGLTLNPVVADGGTTHFDLTLHIVDTEQGLIATGAYNTDLFDPTTMTRMLGHFQTLLEAIVKNPDHQLSELSLLTDAERQQVLLASTNTRTDPISAPCIHRLFEAQVERTPDAIALVFEEEQLTYRELNGRANRIAHRLRKLNVGPEVPVGVCLERSLEMVIGLLAILKAGGVYLPLDPAYPKERMTFMLEDSRAPVLLTQESLTARLPEHRARVLCVDSDCEAIVRESEENPINSSQPGNLAYIIYTSGSTGQPKGVLVSHGSIADHCCDAQRLYQLAPSDRVLQFGSMSFDLSLEQILPTLIVGARLVMAGEVWRATEFHNKASEFGLTVLNLPTAYWQELVREWAAAPAPTLSTQYRLFVVGGDIMLPELLSLWQATPFRFIRLLNAYGPTEATITAAAFEITPRPAASASLPRVPIGRPLANREIYILDRRCNPVPIGVPGELHIGGLNLARGYLNQPDLTADRFIPDPYGNTAGARLYKTGDLARYLPDGNIEYIGRTDHQVKIRGFRIELEEIEAVLAQHPSVRQTIVTAQQDGPGEKRLIAYVVGDCEHAPTANDLHCFLKEKVPEYMVPAFFMLLDSFPTTPNGKVDRGRLPSPQHTRRETEKAFVVPRDDLEVQLVSLWEEVLSVRPIGVTDNFFELGGHSLLAVRLFALIDKRLGKTLPLVALFRGATVELLANLIRQNSASEAPSSLVSIQPAGNKRPLFLVHPAGGHVFPFIPLAHHLGTDQPCYGLQAKGLEEGQDPHTRVEDMAACYIEAIRSVQSEGPYLLGGWSMGGEIAFEMAQQLHLQGQNVALLALLDARIPSHDEEFADEDFEATLLADVARYFGLSLDFGESLAHLPKDELLARALEQGKRAGLVPADIEASDAQRLLELCKSDFRASRNYVLHRYPGRVTLFKASEDLSEASSDPTLGWRDWADGGVDVQVVPGNHASMVYQPNVAILAQKLTACIDQVQSKGCLRDETLERTV
jgi:amino acid adenylation domain-containing protein